jgi:hypothetical protein
MDMTNRNVGKNDAVDRVNLANRLSAAEQAIATHAENIVRFHVEISDRRKAIETAEGSLLRWADERDAIVREMVAHYDQIVDFQTTPTPQPNEAPSQQGDVPEGDDWISWSGGPCPVDGLTLVDIRLASGLSGFHQTSRFADSLIWDGVTNDPIVAYRVRRAHTERSDSPVESAGPQDDPSATPPDDQPETPATPQPEVSETMAERILDQMAGAAAADLLSSGPDVVAHKIYAEGDQLVAREITASEYYAEPPENVTPKRNPFRLFGNPTQADEADLAARTSEAPVYSADHEADTGLDVSGEGAMVGLKQKVDA